jgi:hypothetical protein
MDERICVEKKQPLRSGCRLIMGSVGVAMAYLSFQGSDAPIVFFVIHIFFQDTGVVLGFCSAA